MKARTKAFIATALTITLCGCSNQGGLKPVTWSPKFDNIDGDKIVIQLAQDSGNVVADNWKVIEFIPAKNGLGSNDLDLMLNNSNAVKYSIKVYLNNLIPLGASTPNLTVDCNSKQNCNPYGNAKWTYGPFFSTESKKGVYKFNFSGEAYGNKLSGTLNRIDKNRKAVISAYMKSDTILSKYQTQISSALDEYNKTTISRKPKIKYEITNNTGFAPDEEFYTELNNAIRFTYGKVELPNLLSKDIKSETKNAFISFLNSEEIISEEQIISRLDNIYAPYVAEYKRKLNSSAENPELTCSSPKGGKYFTNVMCPTDRYAYKPESVAIINVNMLGRRIKLKTPDAKFSNKDLDVIISDSLVKVANNTNSYMTISNLSMYFDSRISSSQNKKDIPPSAIVTLGKVDDIFDMNYLTTLAYNEYLEPVTKKKYDSIRHKIGIACNYKIGDSSKSLYQDKTLTAKEMTE